MKIIISPAKNMKTEEVLEWQSYPVFLERAQELKDYLCSLSFAQLQSLWNCNDKIALLNYDRLQAMNLKGDLSPAVLAYDGIQYKYMAPDVFTDRSFQWLNDSLRILSGFYGILRPMDGVVSYRLEMQAKAEPLGYKDLYQFWGDSLYRELTKDDHVILNLASKEYSKCIEDYLTDEDTFIDFVFAEEIDGKLVQKGTLAKMARGEMVRFLAERCAEEPSVAKEFNALDYSFSPEKSTESKYVFIKNNRFAWGQGISENNRK